MESYIFWIVIAVVIIILLTALIYVRKILKAKREKLNVIPEEIMENFLLAEKMLKDSHGDKNPYEIMWEIANKRNNILLNNEVKGGNENGNINTRTDTSDTTTEPGTESNGSTGELEGRSSIPQPTIIESTEHSSTVGTIEPESSDARGGFFSRFKRK